MARMKTFEEAFWSGEKIEPMARVIVKLPLIPGSENQTLHVNVNDYSALIKRGTDVSVPFYVALHLKECEEQQRRTIEMISGMQEDARRI